MVEVRDVNDVPPRWALSEWVIPVPEGEPANTVLATLPVTDPDRSNRLAYRVNYTVQWRSYFIIHQFPEKCEQYFLFEPQIMFEINIVGNYYLP